MWNSQCPINPQRVLAACRPSSAAWFLIRFLGALGMLVIWSMLRHKTPADSSGWLIAVPALSGATVLWRRKRRARILADYQGLHWIALFGWQFVAWEEITDYYEVSIGRAGMTSVIVTPRHKFILPETGWTNISDLRASVQQRATRAHAMSWRRRASLW